MLTKKKWLLNNGHITEIKRGRVSREHDAIMREAVAKGAQIEGYEASKASTPEAETVVKKVSTEDGGIVELAPYRYTEQEHRAYEFRAGKKVERSLREACNGCRVSLVVCYCPEPHIVATNGGGSVRVYIERK